MLQNNSTQKQSKTILVAGGAGFIGAHLCEELVNHGHQVLCIDSFITGSQANIDHLLQLPNFEFIKHDLSLQLDLDESREAQKFQVQFKGIHEIYNLACPTSFQDFAKIPLEILLANSHATKNLLDLAVKHKAKFLHVSASATYGSAVDEKPITEEKIGCVSTTGLRSCYEEGRRFAEALVENYKKIHKLDAKIVRAFSVYGPKMRLGDGRFISVLISQALNNQDVIIYEPVGRKLSYCYILDIVEGLTKVMDTDEIEMPLNIGNPQGISNEELAKKIIELSGSESKIVAQQMPEYLTYEGIPDIAAIQSKTDWFPLVRLEDGLVKTIEDLRASDTFTKYKY